MVLSEVDELDLKIIKTLQEDARASYRKVAEKLDIATGTVQNRVHRLEDIGIIQGYHCHLNYAKLGFNITALIGISIKKEDTARLKRS